MKKVKTLGKPGICEECKEIVDDLIDMDGEKVCKECFAAIMGKPIDAFEFVVPKEK